MTKRLALIVVAIALLTASIIHFTPRRTAFAQANAMASVPGNPNALSYPAGMYFSPAYSQWRGFTETAITVTGSSTTVTLGPSIITLPDGRLVHPFGAQDSALTPIAFDMGAVAETITPTAVSVTSCPTNGDFSPPAQCVNFTGTFTNTHGTHTYVGSGSQGIQEAFADAGSNGGGLVYWQADTGSFTLSTSGLTTTTTALVPKFFISMGASAIVKTTITTSTNWAVGIAGSTSAFCTADSTLTANETCQTHSTLNSPAVVSQGTGTTAILFTVTGANAGAGAVRAKVWGLTPVQALF